MADSTALAEPEEPDPEDKPSANWTVYSNNTANTAKTVTISGTNTTGTATSGTVAPWGPSYPTTPVIPTSPTYPTTWPSTWPSTYPGIVVPDEAAGELTDVDDAENGELVITQKENTRLCLAEIVGCELVQGVGVSALAAIEDLMNTLAALLDFAESNDAPRLHPEFIAQINQTKEWAEQLGLLAS